MKRKTKIVLLDPSREPPSGDVDENPEMFQPKASASPPETKKRKREQTSLWQTPYRPKNSKRDAGVKRTLNASEPGRSKGTHRKPKRKRSSAVTTTTSDGTNTSPDFAPIPLPSAVYNLFQQPHKFPSELDQEYLYATGVPSTVLFETEGNMKLLDPVSLLTSDEIAKRVQRQKRKSWKGMRQNTDNFDGQENSSMVTPSSSSLNTQQLLLNDSFTPRSVIKQLAVKEEYVQSKEDGSFVVKLTGRSKPITFPLCTINISRILEFKD